MSLGAAWSVLSAHITELARRASQTRRYDWMDDCAGWCSLAAECIVSCLCVRGVSKWAHTFCGTIKCVAKYFVRGRANSTHARSPQRLRREARGWCPWCGGKGTTNYTSWRKFKLVVGLFRVVAMNRRGNCGRDEGDYNKWQIFVWFWIWPMFVVDFSNKNYVQIVFQKPGETLPQSQSQSKKVFLSIAN